MGKTLFKTDEEIEEIVNYFNENESTLRATAKHFGISQTYVHKCLKKVKPNETSERILQRNKSERHLRAGQATKDKYLRKKRP